MKVAFLSLNRHDHTNLLPPLFLTTFANNIEKIKWNVDFFNRNYSITDPNLCEQVRHYISDTSPDLLCVPLYVWNHRDAVGIIKEEKKKNRNLKVVVGGPQAFLGRDLIVEIPEIDFLIAGEGEYPFAELLLRLLENPNQPELDSIANLIWSDRSGIHSASPSNEYLFSYKRINNIFMNVELCQFDLPGKTYMIETARGCPFNCSYCCCNKGKRGIRYRPLNIVLEEIYKLHLEAGGFIETLYIVDPSFFVNKKRDIEILKLIKSLQIPFMIELHLDTITPKDLEFLYDCGMHVPSIGLQSFFPDVLRNVNRKPVSKRMLQNLDTLVKLRQSKGVAYMVGIILGLPGDNYKRYKKTIDRLWKYKPPLIDFFHLTILPETRLRNQTEEFGIEYDSEPPYLVTRTHSWSYEDMEKAKTLILTIKTLTTSLGDRILFVITDLLGMSITELVESLQPMTAIEQGIRDVNSKVKDIKRSLLGWTKKQILSKDINQELKDMACKTVEDCIFMSKGSLKKSLGFTDVEMQAFTKETELILNREVEIHLQEYDANKILSELTMLPVKHPQFHEFMSNYKLKEKQYALDIGSSIAAINEGNYNILRLFEKAIPLKEVTDYMEGLDNDGNGANFMNFVSEAVRSRILTLKS